MEKGQNNSTLAGKYGSFEHKWQPLQAMLPTQMTKYLDEIVTRFLFPAFFLELTSPPAVLVTSAGLICSSQKEPLDLISTLP